MSDPIQDRRDQWRATLADRGAFIALSDLEIDTNTDDQLWDLVQYRTIMGGGNWANNPVVDPTPVDNEADEGQE
jgi:hypothetical protein